jgi:hypothetical protein
VALLDLPRFESAERLKREGAWLRVVRSTVSVGVERAWGSFSYGSFLYGSLGGTVVPE